MGADVKRVKPFIFPLTSCHGVLVRHAIGKVDDHLGMNDAPVLPPSSPFFRNIHRSQIQHFQQTIISRKYRFGFGDLAQLAVKTLDGVGGIDQSAHLLGVLEIGAEIGPVSPPGLGDFRIFLVPILRASRAACSSTAA